MLFQRTVATTNFLAIALIAALDSRPLAPRTPNSERSSFPPPARNKRRRISCAVSRRSILSGTKRRSKPFVSQPGSSQTS